MTAKRKSSTSPTARSLKYLRDLGYRAAVVERWNPHVGVRQDLFGFVDILAIRKGETLAVQATSDDHVSHRIRKIAEEPDLQPAVASVRDAGWRIVVHGWRKVAKTGRWLLREVDVS